MKQIERERIYHRFIQHWGMESQYACFIEEMAELTQLLAKELSRKEYGAKDLLSELADVWNLLDEFTLIFGKEEIEQIRDRKLVRAEAKLESQLGKVIEE